MLTDEQIKAIDAESDVGQTAGPDEQAELRREYETGLVIPAKKRSPQLLVCPVGLVGSGKSTVIKPLSERLGLVRISTDEIRHALKNRGFNYAPTREIARSLVEKYLRQGYSVALDADCAGSSRPFIEQAAKALPLKVAWLHIAPPEDFILNKLRNFKHTWLFRDGEQAIEVYRHRKPLHENLDIPFLYTFDTSRSDLEEQVEEAVAKIEALA